MEQPIPPSAPGATAPWWTSGRTFAVGAVVVALSLLTLLWTRDVGLSDRFGIVASEAPEARWRYLLEDVYDRQAYMTRGRWIVSGGTPYLDEFSEYPQLQTLLFGLPWLFLDHGVERGEPHTTADQARAYFAARGLGDDAIEEALGRVDRAVKAGVPLSSVLRTIREEAAGWPPALVEDPEAVAELVTRLHTVYAQRHTDNVRNVTAYGNAHHVFMAGWWLLLLAVQLALLRQVGRPPFHALAMFLPSTLYFGFNRSDLPVVTVFMLAALLTLRDRRTAAAAVIGLAGMIKWFPLFVFPIFLSFGLRRARLATPDRPWRSLVVDEVLRPCIVVGGVVLAFLGLTYFWDDGGWKAVTYVFEWHLARNHNHASVLAMLCSPKALGLFSPEALHPLSRVFLVIQLGTPFLLALLPLQRARDLFAALALSLAVMIVFSKFFSPQWALWLVVASTPLLALSRWLVVTLVGLQFILYLQLPVALYERGVDTTSWDWTGLFAVATSLRVAAFGLSVVVLAAMLPHPWRRTKTATDPAGETGP